MGNFHFFKSCESNDNNKIEDIYRERLTRRNNKRYFVLTKGDFLEVNKIYEKHELHKVFD